MRRLNLEGKVFNRLTVKEYQPESLKWICLCSCGNTTLVNSYELTHNSTKSCGCLKKEVDKTIGNRRTTHGMTCGGKWDPLYRTWVAVKERCTNPNYKYWDRYGGRGITMYKPWMDSFSCFAEDVGPKPFPKAEIDRKENDGNYEPGNIRWVTHKINCQNQSKTIFLTFNNETKPLSEWTDLIGGDLKTTRARLRRGWTPEEIISTPKLEKGQKRK